MPLLTVAIMILVPASMAGTHPAFPASPSPDQYTCHLNAEPGHATPDGCPSSINWATSPSGIAVAFHNNDPAEHLVQVWATPAGGTATKIYEECLTPQHLPLQGYSRSIPYVHPNDSPPMPHTGNGDGSVTMDQTDFGGGPSPTGSFQIDWWDGCIPCPLPPPANTLFTCQLSKSGGGIVGNL